MSEENRCRGKTIKGNRCRRMVSTGEYCWQHQPLLQRWLKGIGVTGAIALVVTIIGFVADLSSLDLLPGPQQRIVGADLGIAVVGFLDADDFRRSELGDNLALGIEQRLDRTLDDMAKEFVIIVWGPSEIALPISGESIDERAESARKIAEQINADIVIYGVIDESTGAVTPEFYVSSSSFLEATELVGQYELGTLRTDLPVGDIESLPGRLFVNDVMAARVKVLAHIVLGLGYYVRPSYGQAQDQFALALAVDGWEDTDGKEVAHVLLANAYGKDNNLENAEHHYLKALEINYDYARAHAGLGSVTFAKAVVMMGTGEDYALLEKLSEALDHYENALAAKKSPASADIPPKSHFGIGRVYLLRSILEKGDMALAANEFLWVIDDYEQRKLERLKERAVEAHAMLGLIYRHAADEQQAVNEYLKAIELITGDRRLEHNLGRFYAAIAEIYSESGSPAEASAMYKKAIDLTKNAEERELYEEQLRALQLIEE